MKLLKFITAMIPRLEKNKVVEDLRITADELDKTCAPSFRAAAEFFKTSKLKSDANKDLSDIFYRNFDQQGSGKLSSFVADIDRRMPHIRDNVQYIQTVVEDLLERDVIAEGLTAKKALILRAAESLSFISRFSTDLLNFVYVNEAIEINAEIEENMRLSPAAIKHVQMRIDKFANLISSYGIPNKDFSKLLATVPEIIINSKTANSIKGVYKDQDIDPMEQYHTSGFTSNPIYHLRLVVAEWQANRFKANKEKKQILELRLLHLKLLQNKKNDPKLENEINYIQSRIDGIDKYLLEVEQDLETEE